MLGVAAGTLREPGVHVEALAGDLADCRGAYLLRRESGVVFAVAAPQLEWVREVVR